LDQATLRWINFAFEALQALAALFALWLASGIALQQFVGDAREDEPVDFTQAKSDSTAEDSLWQPRFSRGLAIVLWLVLAGFFYLPLTDLITGLRTAVFLGIGWSEMGLSPAFNSFGSIAQNYYFLFTLVLLILVYGFVLVVGRRAFSDKPGSLLEELPLSSIERTFMLLGAAGLVHFLINNLLVTLIWIDLPNQTAQPQGGALPFMAPAIVGGLLVLLLVFWMNSALLREEIQMEEDWEADETWETDEEGEAVVEYEIISERDDDLTDADPDATAEPKVVDDGNLTPAEPEEDDDDTTAVV
jgi:hypothetical protein